MYDFALIIVKVWTGCQGKVQSCKPCEAIYNGLYYIPIEMFEDHRESAVKNRGEVPRSASQSNFKILLCKKVADFY